jgi:hypothetical protein
VTATPAQSAPEAVDSAPRRARPALWWAAAGAAFVLLQVYVYGAWITSGGFRPSPVGPDIVPTWEKPCAWILQPLFTIGGLAAAAWVIRGCLRERRLMFDPSTCRSAPCARP